MASWTLKMGHRVPELNGQKAVAFSLSDSEGSSPLEWVSQEWGRKAKEEMRFAPSGSLWGPWEGSSEEVFKLSQTGPDYKAGHILLLLHYFPALRVHSILGWPLFETLFEYSGH